jgi:predicted PolB exonuclease-like 3'-5' exonuclease
LSTWYAQYRRAHGGSDFAPLHLQRVVAIGCVLRESDAISVWSSAT